jgi:hypothetical protein
MLLTFAALLYGEASISKTYGDANAVSRSNGKQTGRPKSLVQIL